MIIARIGYVSRCPCKEESFIRVNNLSNLSIPSTIYLAAVGNNTCKCELKSTLCTAKCEILRNRLACFWADIFIKQTIYRIRNRLMLFFKWSRFNSAYLLRRPKK